MTDSTSYSFKGFSRAGKNIGSSSAYAGRVQRVNSDRGKTKGQTPTNSSSNSSESGSLDHDSGVKSISRNSSSKSKTIDSLSKSDDSSQISTPPVINLVAFQDYVKILKPYLNSQVSDLQVSLKESLNNLNAVIKLAGPADRARLDKILVDVLLDGQNPALIKYAIGSVGAKIFGCSSSNCPNVSLGCSPGCAGSIPSIPSITGYAPCENQVLMFNGTTFELLSSPTTPNKEAIVYVNKDFKGFNQSQINELKNRGIESVKIIYHNNTECTHISPTFVALNNLIVSPSSQKQDQALNSQSVSSQNVQKTAENDNTFWWWVLGIVVVLAIILIIIWLVKSKKASQNKIDGLNLNTYMNKGISGIEASSFTHQLSSGFTPQSRSPIFSTDTFRMLARQPVPQY